MAKNITLLGASYSNVPAVNLPQTGGGTARFTDTSPTTATDSDVASGKIYFKSDGSQSTGTSSGGGGGGGIEITQDAQGYIVLPEQGGGSGGSSWTLLNSAEVTTSYSSTTAQLLTTYYLSSDVGDPTKIIYVRIRDKAGRRNSHFYGCDAFIEFRSSNANTIGTIAQFIHSTNSNGANVVYVLATSTASTGYGVYTKEVAILSTSVRVQLYEVTNAQYAPSIDGTYTVDIYQLTSPDGLPFV